MKNMVAIYCRLSVEDDNLDEGGVSESIKNQKLLLRDYAIKQGWNIYDTYCDEDLKGFDRDRPEFNRLLKDAEKGCFSIILCKHQSRFTRDMELVEKYINGRFILWGIRFVSIIDNVDTNVKGNKKARQINALINEWYSEDLSDNIRATFRKKMENGEFLGSFACYGYKKCPQDRHKIIVDSEASEVVKEIFGLYLSGKGAYKIANILTAKKTPTPSQYKMLKGLKYANANSNKILDNIGVWNPGTVKRILSNEVYIGKLIQGKERKISYKSNKVIAAPASEWVTVENNHEPIIDKKTFELVRELAKSKRRTCKSEKVKINMPNIFSGKLKCASCGSNMQRSGMARDRSTYYYRCSLSAKTKGEKCSPRCIRQDIIECYVIEKIQSIINSYLTEGNYNLLREDLLKTLYNKTDTKELTKEVEALEKKIKSIYLKMTRAYTDKLNGTISENEFNIYKSVYEEEKKTYEDRKQYLLDKCEYMQKDLININEVDNFIIKYLNIKSLNYDIVNDFIQTIEVGDSKVKDYRHLLINWNF